MATCVRAASGASAGGPRLLLLLLTPQHASQNWRRLRRLGAWPQRAFSAATPPSKDEHEALSVKRKLAADIEKARKLALHQVVNVPNVITFARVLSTPYLAYLIVDGQHEAAIGLRLMLTGGGRRASIIGSFLDPFADKLMIGALSVSMMWSGLLPWPLVTLIFGRDVLLVGGTFYHRLKTKDAESAFFDTSDSGAFEVKPSLLSKVNTALQFALFGLTLTNAAWHVPFDPALQALFGVVGATTFASGSEYLYSYVNQTGAFRPIQKAVKAVGLKKKP
ncbi:hypothetical protein PybrP1_009236 [[Pythium] brassicae (nom. inval.)]|nr:hypothetical protein PybrP1_009236 [[Pythium] brassicae (nom. inval.)]